MARYIDADAFIKEKRDQYCKNCQRRIGIKRGKQVIAYDIGDAPCKSCGINDMLEEIDDFEDADLTDIIPKMSLPEKEY